jgi:hypothetical protein
VVGGGLLLSGRGVGLAAAATAVVYALAVYLTSRAIEGPRKATDRLVTVVVTTAFLIAMIPLVSVVVTVLANGLARFDVAFFTNSMRGVVGEGGGGYHAIVGTLIITALAALMSIPVGLLDRRLPGGVRPGEAGPGDHVLRRRHDRHPVHRGRPVRLRALRAVLRPEHPDGLHGSVALSCS